MLSIQQLQQYFPPHLQSFQRSILREYLQYKILEIIFNSQYSNQLVFLGGTALRIVYNNMRFSEDLDFDNLGLTHSQFSDLGQEIQKKMRLEGYEVEIRTVFKGAYHCYIKIPKLLYQNNLSPLEEEKILIQFDTVPQNFAYIPDNKILNKFDVFKPISVTPLDLLLSQKIFTAFNRKRPKGRDFYDIIFLLSLIQKPNYQYLEKNIGINTSLKLKTYILDQSQNLNFKILTQDVKAFLFNPKDSQKISLFRDFIHTIEFQ